MDSNDVTCPFCGEGDFDLTGLKGHLDWCDAYHEIDDPPPNPFKIQHTPANAGHSPEGEE